MAFVSNGEDTTESNKQHLNLSTFAYEVLSNDMFAFGQEKLSGFINTVFEHYYPQADASISRTLNSFRGDLEKILDDVGGDTKTKEYIVKRLLQEKRDSLIKKAESYEKGKAFKFWINKNNLEYLTEKDSECGEDAFYARKGKYIKSIIEEYARLPYIERELIFFKPFIESIEEAIRDEKQLRIVTGADSVYSVFPYKVLHDPLSTTNYLVGYSKRYTCVDDEKRPCSFKISALKSIKIERSKSAFLKSSERKQLKQTITSRGVQFMVSDEAEIYVRLTPSGIFKYQRQTHLRPSFVKRQDDIFVFNCTMAQAEFYFFKFGQDAEVLSPDKLRIRFLELYKASIKKYLHERK